MSDKQPPGSSHRVKKQLTLSRQLATRRRDRLPYLQRIRGLQAGRIPELNQLLTQNCVHIGYRASLRYHHTLSSIPEVSSILEENDIEDAVEMVGEQLSRMHINHESSIQEQARECDLQSTALTDGSTVPGSSRMPDLGGFHLSTCVIYGKNSEHEIGSGCFVLKEN